MTPDGVLVLGGRHPALAAARALWAAGYRVIAGDGGEYSTLRYSRACAEVWAHPPVRSGEAFLAALRAFIERRPDIVCILPLHDRYVALLSATRHRLPKSVALASAASDVVEACLDKRRMYALASELGVPHPPVLEAADLGSLERAADAVGYPCVIRPARFGTPMPQDRKAVVCADRRAFTDLLRLQPVNPDGWLVQRYVAGVRHNLWFAAAQGRLVACLQAATLRTDRMDGTGILVEGVVVPTDPRLRESLDALIQRLEYTGVGGAQFIVPDTGQPAFLEINPRPAGTGLPLLRRCGLDLALAAVDLADDAAEAPGRSRVKKSDPRCPAGQRYAWTSRDLYALGMAVSRHEVGRRAALRWLQGAFLAAVRADVHLVWDRRDPLPALVLYAHLATLPWLRVRGTS